MDLRKIEQTWRLLWMRAIARALPGPRTAALPDPSRFPLRVLFLRYERIGDMIMATGMIRVLAQASSGITLDVVATPATRPVLDHNPHVNKVFTLDRKSWKSYHTVGRQLRAEQYDVIVDGRINNPAIFTSTPILMLYAGARYRVGVRGRNNDLIYNVRVRPFDRRTHYIEASKELAEPFDVNVENQDWRPEIFLTDNEIARANAVWSRAESQSHANDDGRLLVNLSASEVKRRWSDENFIEVLRAVRAGHPHVPIVVIGLPAEWDSVQRVATEIDATAAATPRLRDALALVGTSDRVFTPDTSISHAASAFSKPAVVLLKRDHAPYAPWDTEGEIIFWDGATISELQLDTVRDVVLDWMHRPVGAAS